MAYVTDKTLKTEINSLMVKVDNNFTKKKQAIEKIELVKAIPTVDIGTSTEKVNCLRLYYVDHETKTDTNGDLIPHYIDISVEGLNGFKLRKWVTSEDYSEKEYVVYDYKLYQANQDITGDVDFDKTKYDLIIGGSSETVLNWISGKDYVVNDKVANGNYVYKCIKDHTSADFDLEKDNWIIALKEYYSLSQDQYDQMVTDGLITNNNKELFIVSDDVNPLGDIYEETIGIDKISTQWVIQHNLKQQYPSHVYVFDEDENEIVLPTIEYKTENLLLISFDTPLTGSVKVIK